jgi:hypothetical protein
MTLLLDIAALLTLVLTLSFVPFLGIRTDARITREILDAEKARETARQPARQASAIELVRR